ncbi:DUF1616 domain-containing protein [Methanomethylovorans sp.]|uniref:DUF1616 domain-containing protein n=1 Tax=Methanomethylovorans sp. TaxID=2758717 RepID=UPI00351BFD56
MSIQMLAGSILVLFVPGLAWTYALFDKKEIDLLERVALSLGLSLAMVPLSLFYLYNLLGIRINLANSVSVVLLLTAAAVCVILLRSDKTARLRNK